VARRIAEKNVSAFPNKLCHFRQFLSAFFSVFLYHFVEEISVFH